MLDILSLLERVSIIIHVQFPEQYYNLQVDHFTLRHVKTVGMCRKNVAELLTLDNLYFDLLMKRFELLVCNRLTVYSD